MEKLKDSDIRRLLKKKLTSIDEFRLDPSTIVIDELDVCSGLARVDVAVVNGKLHGFEIKSERDNLDRLSSQIELYSKVFNMVTLVVSESHLSKAKEMVPKWWGIDCVKISNSNVSIKHVRKAKANKHIDINELGRLL